MPPNETERQHWIPKLLLKKFADIDGRLFRLEIATDKITKPPPKNAAARAGFNNFKVAGGLISFEDQLERLETQAAPAFARIIATRSLAQIDADERKKIAEFIAAQTIRTEAFRKGFDANMQHDEFGPLLTELWRSLFVQSSSLNDRDWALLVINSDEVFYLGDQPVVLQRTEKPSDGANIGIDITGVEVMMPISPKIALYLPCKSVSSQIIRGYQDAIALHRALRSAIITGLPGGSNELRVAQRAIVSSGPLYKALTTGEAFQAQLPHIENLNYLQCSWAHAAIYSNKKDFSFAQRVFSENPQYKATPAVKIVRKNIFIPDELAKTFNLE